MLQDSKDKFNNITQHKDSDSNEKRILEGRNAELASQLVEAKRGITYLFILIKF
jgi:hypothetical protein